MTVRAPDRLDRPLLANHGPEEFSRLWLVALATYGVGDVVTTITLLWFDGRVAEANGLLRAAVDAYGLAGLVGFKLVVFLVTIGVSLYGDRIDDSLLYYLPPAVLAVFGGFAAAFNLRLLLG